MSIYLVDGKAFSPALKKHSHPERQSGGRKRKRQRGDRDPCDQLVFRLLLLLLLIITAVITTVTTIPPTETTPGPPYNYPLGPVECPCADTFRDTCIVVLYCAAAAARCVAATHPSIAQHGTGEQQVRPAPLTPRPGPSSRDSSSYPPIWKRGGQASSSSSSRDSSAPRHWLLLTTSAQNGWRNWRRLPIGGERVLVGGSRFSSAR